MAKARRSKAHGEPPQFDPDAVDALLAGRTPMAKLDELFRQMKRTLMETVLRGDLTHHLGYAHGQEKLWKEIGVHLPAFRRHFPRAQAIELKIRMRPEAPDPFGDGVEMRQER